MSGWIESCHNLAQTHLIIWIALRRITQPSSCGLQSTWWPGHGLVFQAHLAPSCPTSLYITYFSLTTPRRYYSIHLREDRFCGFCITLYKTVLDFSIIYTNLPSWAFQNAGPWLRQNQLQTEHNNIHQFWNVLANRWISCSKTKKAQCNQCLPWNFWFLTYEMSR